MNRQTTGASKRLGIFAGLGMAIGLALGGCATPETDVAAQAKTEVLRTQTGWTPVALEDLEADDAATWKAERAGQDPGFLAGDLFGDGRPAFAALVKQNGAVGMRARLVLLGQEPSGRFVSYTLFTESPIDRMPMIWKSNAEEYEVYANDQLLRVPVEGIVYQHTGVGRKLFFWNQDRFLDVELGAGQ